MKPIIRSLKEVDLDEADRISRIAFGTFLGLLDPGTFYGDADFVRTRFRADPSLSLAAEMYGQLVGSNFVANWGSVGFFGPLTVRPDLWDKGIAKNLLDKTLEIFERVGTKHIGLFTFSHSPKHIHLYQKYDFWPRFLTNVMSKHVGSVSKTKEHELRQIGSNIRTSHTTKNQQSSGIAVRSLIQSIRVWILGTK